MPPFSPILPATKTITITSPNFPGPYTNDQNNTWIVTTGGSGQAEDFSIYIDYFDTYYEHFVTVRDGLDNVLLHHSGDTMPHHRTIHVRTNIVNIEFKTTGNSDTSGIVGKKFRIIVTAFQSAPEVVSTISNQNEIVFHQDPKLVSMMTNASMCWSLNKTWVDDMSEAIMNVHSALDCQNLCKERSTNALTDPGNYCSYFTWFGPEAPSFNRLCLLYAHISTSAECTHCVSGHVSCTCSNEHACTLHNDVVIGIHEPVYYEFICQEMCRRNDTCNYYSWFDKSGTLFQATSCNSDQKPLLRPYV